MFRQASRRIYRIATRSSGITYRRAYWHCHARLYSKFAIVAGTAVTVGGICLCDTKKATATIGQVFKDVYPKLEKATLLMEEHKDLPKKTYVYGKSQESNELELGQVLDEAMASLELSSLSDPRTQIRQLQQASNESLRKIDEYRKDRISAPIEPTFGLHNIPGFRTKSNFDELIEKEQAKIVANETEIKRIKTEFITQAIELGLEVSVDSLETLLESVTGDDLINMGIVFHNCKCVAQELEMLTESSAEALDIAERYYGMYVVLLKVVDRSQNKFIHDIDTMYKPLLEGYMEEATNNIEQAKVALEKLAQKDIHDAILEQNIESNQLTHDAARAYCSYLNQQQELVRQRNKELQESISIASNTHATVKLSRNVAGLIRSGRRNFEALMQMKMPELRGFENDQVRAEFRGLTSRIQKAGAQKK